MPLSRVAEITLLTGLPEINRDNLKPMVAVTARIVGRDLGSTAADVQALLDKSGLFPQGTYFQLGGLYHQQQLAFRGLMIVLAAAVALVFFLLLYLYESMKMAIVIIAMPLCALGAVFMGLWAHGRRAEHLGDDGNDHDRRHRHRNRGVLFLGIRAADPGRHGA